ncbi:hypothetical protein AB0I22_39660 [Streptomyces sp. NPDC050610]|uniref:hypothetical protein n=1 Tax=Streptomyces sp. NPDC050610 TaxID=3157097 RepID=UPI00341CD292
MTAIPQPAYPVTPDGDDDPRFTTGLAFDVAFVLETHGFPKLTNGLDFVDLQQALFRFLYVAEGRR